MVSMYQRCIHLISKPPDQREAMEIDFLSPWIRKQSDILKGADRDVLRKLIQQCGYLKVTKDHVIIRQGEKGECFYIMLTGRTSVFIDPTKTEEEAPRVPEALDASQAILQELEEERKKKLGKKKTLDRSKYGNFIIHFDAGKSFGEIALMNENAERNASIIADEDTDLLVIHRDLFNKTLKAKQEQEYRERRAFIRHNPLFRKWNPRFQKLLEMSLRKETLAFDSHIVRQGQPVQGLHFIVKGQAKIVVEPASHRSQYTKLFEVDDSVIEKEFGRKQERKEEKSRDSMLSEQIRVRRRQGYAAAERRLANKALDLCFVDDSEVIGDIELVFGLDTYCQSIVCTSNVEALVLDTKNIERLIYKKNQQTIDMLKAMLENKLNTRIITRGGSQVELYQRLISKIEESKPKRSSLTKVKEKEGRDLMMSQLAKLFIEDRSPMIEPAVPGTVYYMTKSAQRAQRKAMKARAQKRASSAQEKPLAANVRLERAKRATRQARSRRELERLTAQPESHSLSAAKDNGATRYLAQAGIDANKVRPNTAAPEVNGQGDGDTYQADEVMKRRANNQVFKLTEVFSEQDDMVQPGLNNDMSEDSIRRIVQEMGDAQYKKDTSRTKIICSMVEKQMTKQPASIQQLLRPKSAPVKQRAVSKDGEEEEDDYEFDWETGETALRDLETRMHRFHRKFEERNQTPTVMAMKRFQVQTPEDVPIPGGTVYVKQRLCSYTSGSAPADVSGHSHVRRFMIPRHALAVASKTLINAYNSAPASAAQRPQSAKVPNSTKMTSAKSRATSAGPRMKGSWR